MGVSEAPHLTIGQGVRALLFTQLLLGEFATLAFKAQLKERVNKSFWASAYYHQQRAKGCTHQAALRALAFKWIRILYRCWEKRTPYDEVEYLRTLERRGSPLLEQFTTSK